jgi:cell division protein FtsN
MAVRGTKKRKAGRRKKPTPTPGWVWLLIGLSIGLAVALAIYMNDRQPGKTGPAEEKPATSAPAATDSEKRRNNEYTFYGLLPSFEVVIPEEYLDAKPDQPTAPVAEPGAYVLQTGSFLNYADADRMKAQLALLGIVSAIQKVTVDEKTYHRVRIGPIDNLTELNRVRGQLHNAGIKPMLIRVAS